MKHKWQLYPPSQCCHDIIRHRSSHTAAAIIATAAITAAETPYLVVSLPTLLLYLTIPLPPELLLLSICRSLPLHRCCYRGCSCCSWRFPIAFSCSTKLCCRWKIWRPWQRDDPPHGRYWCRRHQGWWGLAHAEEREALGWRRGVAFALHWSCNGLQLKKWPFFAFFLGWTSKQPNPLDSSVPKGQMNGTV